VRACSLPHVGCNDIVKDSLFLMHAAVQQDAECFRIEAVVDDNSTGGPRAQPIAVVRRHTFGERESLQVVEVPMYCSIGWWGKELRLMSEAAIGQERTFMLVHFL
jgi:hypothetical protein